MIKEQLQRLKDNWGLVASLTALLITLSGSFLIDLPEWSSDLERKAYVEYGRFTGTIIAIFMVIISLKERSRKLWLLLSICSFLFLSLSYVFYLEARSNLTLPYQEIPGKPSVDKVIGREKQPNFDVQKASIEKAEKRPVVTSELLFYVGGRPELLWTEESISRSKYILVILYNLTFSLFAIFFISLTTFMTFYAKPKSIQPM